MNIDLNEAEIKKLTQILKNYQSDLKIETRRSMDFHYKDKLKGEAQLIGNVINKLSELIGEQQESLQ